jgi:hypothetical protein
MSESRDHREDDILCGCSASFDVFQRLCVRYSKQFLAEVKIVWKIDPERQMGAV